MPKIPLLVIRKRITVLMLLCVLLALGLAGRLVYIQLMEHSFFMEKGLEQRLRPIPIDAYRGTIRDANGEVLAESKSAAAVFAIPIEVKDPQGTALKLASILDVDYDFLYQRLTKRSAAEWLKKRVSDEEARRVTELELPGIGVVDNPVRSYPMGSIAPQILGLVGVDNQGLEGIELYYDKELRGTPGRLLVERDASGRQIPHGVQQYVPPVDGYDLTLTIDHNIQRIAQREVERAVAETGSRKGLIMIMNPKTGAILAAAQVPNYDITNHRAYPQENRRLIAVTDPYEPGSSFKAVTAAAALEEGVASLNRSFFDPGYMIVSGWRIKCWNRGGHGPQTFVQTLENSCNPVYATLGIELGGERFYDYMMRFGMGKRLGLDFPGEAPGKIRSPGPKVPLVTWANIGFGQGLMITPLQLLCAFATIANGGKLMRPYLVQEIRDRSGKLIKETEPQLIRQAVSQKTADTTRMMLRSVVAKGSGKRADVPGYPVAGKTGTAQLVEGGRYSHSKVASSFLGFAPSDDPVMAGTLVLWEPGGAFYGGIIAAPVFSRLVAQVLPAMGVKRRPTKKTSDRPVVEVRLPSLRGYSIDEAQRTLTQMGLLTSVMGGGDQVLAQVPAEGAEVPRGTRVILYTDPRAVLEEGLISPLTAQSDWSSILP
ncbi:MAG: penicillin-binding transpeptidase domain-containing protein [Limnochordia bacterium]|jgi:stage V sporulation protein D (sporulation-specific penicillin-binding protein)|nr:PASTA domain-containing protein [Bacillota bacterium]